MGLLSKIFGGDGDAEKAAKDLIQGIFNAATSQKDSSDNGSSTATDPVVEEGRRSAALSGSSWGDEMPEEENQYNYNGSFTQYFESIFSNEFAAYRTDKENISNGSRVIYTFYSGTGKALVVELMPDSCSAYKIREDCRKAGVPYLRFYYNHNGWWNTRSYVTGRIKKALNM
ncbi:MAG: hypothetical protein K6E85_02905 [Lachnospiraceae bacterium]|nr:hypothetical protein [Lachnospiraceae bacterium]